MKTTHDLHMDIHDILKDGNVLAAVNAALKARNHQAIEYGQLKSMLHLHYLCHALNQNTQVFVQIGDGEIKPAVSTYRPSDKIGRVMNALVIRAE